MADHEEKTPAEPVRVHVTTGHRTVGDALFAAADAAKRAPAAAAPLVRTAAQILAVGLAIIGAMSAVVAAVVYVQDRAADERREMVEAQQAAAAAQAEVREAKQRRAVLDLLEPAPGRAYIEGGLVLMLCPVKGEIIGRQIVMLPPKDVRASMSPCRPGFPFGQDCSKGSYDCTPATEVETAAWDRAFKAAPEAQRQAVARRAVVGADPNPRVPVLDTETGALYDIGRAELASVLSAHPSYIPATPAQVAAWRGAQ